MGDFTVAPARSPAGQGRGPHCDLARASASKSALRFRPRSSIELCISSSPAAPGRRSHSKFARGVGPRSALPVCPRSGVEVRIASFPAALRRSPHCDFARAAASGFVSQVRPRRGVQLRIAGSLAQWIEADARVAFESVGPLRFTLNRHRGFGHGRRSPHSTRARGPDTRNATSPEGATGCSHGWSAARALAGEAQPVESVNWPAPPRQGRRQFRSADSPAPGPRLGLPRPLDARMQIGRGVRVCLTPTHLSRPRRESPADLVVRSDCLKRGCLVAAAPARGFPQFVKSSKIPRGSV